MSNINALTAELHFHDSSGQSRAVPIPEDIQLDVTAGVAMDQLRASLTQVARALNQEAVPSPGGRIWYDSAIRGQPERGDGIRRHETYRGLVVWGRRHR